MPTCPNGHQSGSDDWCEVCGHRMAGGAGAPAGAVPPPPPPPPPAPGPPPPAPGYDYPGPAVGDPNATQQAELCPQCRTPREAMAPFCEECRWNFLTNTATSYTPVAPPPSLRPGGPGHGPGGPGPGGPGPGLNLPPGFQSAPPPSSPPPPPAPHTPRPPDPYEYQGSRPSQVNRPAEPLTPRPADEGDDWVLSPPSQPHPPQQPAPAPPPQAVQAPAPPPAPAPAPPQQHQQPQQAQQPHQGPHQGPPPHAAPPPPPAPQPPYQSQAPQRPEAPHFPAAPAGWTASVAPDREYFMAMMRRSGPEAAGLNLPAYSPEQHLPLSGTQVTIGRRRHSTGESPDIDLSVPPEDPGVSHQHAVLVQQPDGSWAVVDQNSTNGTTLNGAEDPIQPYVPVPLKDGDQVHVGAWTTITIRRG
ncbi:FHA domain-containing protein [Streptomyces sp. NPDC047928]|uniref:FHA domain-containing protein n=1 Tax=unclassified Streptomyces TaxID=2593676 RepID=UPI00371D1F34